MLILAGKMSMTDTEFEALAERALAAVEHAIEATGLDVDLQFKGAGVLEIEFHDGSRMIVNRHAAAREIWVAAKSGGFHFCHDGKAWRDTRDGAELFAVLSGLVSAQGGAPVTLQPG